jgi:hypothetical protein
MFRNIKISTKIALLIIGLSLVAVVAISTFTYRINVQQAQEKISISLNTVADQRALLVNQYFDNLKNVLTFLQQANALANIVPDSTSDVSPEKALLQTIQQSHGFMRAMITNTRGNILFSSDDTHGTLPDPENTFFTRASGHIAFSHVPRDSTFMYVGAPFEGRILVVKVDLKPVFKHLGKLNIGKTAEAYLAYPDVSSKNVTLISPLLYPGKTLLEPSTPGTKEPLLAVDGKEGNAVTTD